MKKQTNNRPVYPYRVFICYAREDNEKALKIETHLRKLGLQAMRDPQLRLASDYPGQIKDFIAFAHIFIPLLTKSSIKRPWVGHEIGYAVGVGVPVLPVVIGTKPEGFIEKVQALTLKPDLSDLARRLTAKKLEDVGRDAPAVFSVAAVFSCESAPLPEDRTAMIIRYAKSVLQLGFSGKVRQSAVLSSFSLPSIASTFSLGGADAHDKLLLEERKALESHARNKGCDLIIDLSVNFPERPARLRALRNFLADMPDDKVRVVLRKFESNLIIVDDWFLAESISPDRAKGFLQTVFTRHAHTVRRRMEQFDEVFQELLSNFAKDGKSSRDKAIAAIDKEIRALEERNGTNAPSSAHAPGTTST